ncbi:hypothetical protein M441DRAFT_60201 [Trichoderma asperellum CBS 433.97]|uniref:GPI anchored protein n=1 Tax=Trichoderma asperellum (strain ATCC 204424 / CBS 433.97 / NBRC 101777) TaxID=1042311 RepID=A0A2T3Z2E7_TRIA4|nr:hypothetical protein M441DRAFT_60201 [Trichoderma asperellum CBS 433.97]PTB38991.1 hypothetical protein M441DRAFT_60201 [Trichoderma asperellum CBS 433.97]
MTSIPRMLVLPTAFLALVAEVVANQPLATAIKKQLPDANEKLFPDHLAFEPLPALNPFETTVATNLWLDDQEDKDASSSNSTKRYHPAFSYHFQESEEDLLKRAADVLVILQNRAACPSGMESCSSIGSPDKCCADGTYCTNVSDSDSEQIACCPDGATCGGGVGACPSDAVSCPSELGGGCCIPGYVCQGVGCVPSASATGIPSSTAPPPQTTPQTRSTAATATGPGTETATGAPPYRPTDATSTSSSASSSTSSAPMTTTQSGETQTGCPTGFYGCLATHGGGCCRTDRDCQTLSCPAPSSTIISHGVTVVVPAGDVPTATASDKCASGWFLCGKDAGSVAGCCPSGYKCGTASCFTSAASETNSVQKQEPEAPSKNAASSAVSSNSLIIMGGITGTLLLLLGVL